MDVARAVLAAHYPDAAFAFVAGSLIRGEGGRFSDIDLVIVYDRIDAAWRESFVFDGLPVEAFVHDPETLAWFVGADIARGRPSILNMIADGVVIGSRSEGAEAMREAIVRHLAEGPPPLDPADLASLRYEITDAVDDLRDPRSDAEIVAIGAMLHERLTTLMLRGRGSWDGRGKWGPRLLRRIDGDAAARLDQAFGMLFRDGDADAIIALADRELQPFGGYLFDGDRRDAPPSWRSAGFR